MCRHNGSGKEREKGHQAGIPVYMYYRRLAGSWERAPGRNLGVWLRGEYEHFQLPFEHSPPSCGQRRSCAARYMHAVLIASVLSSNLQSLFPLHLAFHSFSNPLSKPIGSRPKNRRASQYNNALTPFSRIPREKSPSAKVLASSNPPLLSPPLSLYRFPVSSQIGVPFSASRYLSSLIFSLCHTNQTILPSLRSYNV